jgi:hypothetical protein
MATQMIPTASQDAYASVLLARSARWARGYDRRTGRQFVMFTSSRTDGDGRPIYHRTAVDGSGCTCNGYRFRGACSHALACRLDAERAREQVTRRATYDELYQGSGFEFTDAF